MSLGFTRSSRVVVSPSVLGPLSDSRVRAIISAGFGADLLKHRNTIVPAPIGIEPGRQDPQVRVSDIAPRGQLPRQRA